MVKEAYSGNLEKALGHDLFVTDFVGFFFPHEFHWTRNSSLNLLINGAYTGSYWESAAFLGYLVLPMGVWAAIKKKFALKKYFIIIGFLGAIFSLGPYLHVFGRPIEFIKLPGWLIEHMPLLSVARSPSRFVVLTYLALAVFAAYAAEAWFNYLKTRWGKNVFRIGVIGLAMAIMLDYWSVPFEMTKIQVPGYYKTIKADTDEFAILNLPLVGWSNNERYMYYQTIHNKPICGGQLARSTLKYFAELKNLSLSPENLKHQKIKFIILHRAFLDPGDYQKLDDAFGNRFELFARDNLGTVFRTYR